MKNLTVILITLMLSQICIGQDHVVKLGLGSLLTKKLYLGYEYKLNEKQTLNLSLGYIIPKKLPMYSIYESSLHSAQNVDFKHKYQGFSVLAEYRIYPGADNRYPAPRGFYAAPYLGVNRWAIDFDFIEDAYEAKMEAILTRIHGGVQIGYQWLLNDVFSFDFSIIGLGLGMHNASASYISEDPGKIYEEVAEEANADLEDLPWVGDKVKFEAGEDLLKVKAKFLLPTIRSSFTIGYAF